MHMRLTDDAMYQEGSIHPINVPNSMVCLIPIVYTLCLFFFSAYFCALYRPPMAPQFPQLLAVFSICVFVCWCFCVQELANINSQGGRRKREAPTFVVPPLLLL